jgi:prepilin-type N-terminal cleavage/methylation domain-containing protein
MNKKGFTLVEIMAVVALIAIISVAAILSVTSIINNQRIRTATISEKNISEASLALNTSDNRYIPICRDKATSNYTNFDEILLKSINDAYRTNMTSLGITNDKAKANYMKNISKKIKTDVSFKEVFNNTYLNVKDINCFRVNTVGELLDSGYLKDLDNGCDRASLVLIYQQGDSSNQAGTLTTAQESGICKGSSSEEKGPTITVDPERSLTSSSKKIIKVTAKDKNAKLENRMILCTDGVKL